MIMDDSEINDINTVKEIYIPMIHRFDRLMFVIKEMNGNIMRLNGEFELQLTIEDVCDQLHTLVPSTNHFIMIEVFGNNSKNKARLEFHLDMVKCMMMMDSWCTRA